jgi:hypothetical protein
MYILAQTYLAGKGNIRKKFRLQKGNIFPARRVCSVTSRLGAGERDWAFFYRAFYRYAVLVPVNYVFSYAILQT